MLARAGMGLLWLESGPVGLWFGSPAAALVPGAGLSSNPPLQTNRGPGFSAAQRQVVLGAAAAELVVSCHDARRRPRG